MKHLDIKLGKGRNPLTLDASKLIRRCALIQGGRDSGKSYLARVIVEQTIPAGLQTIILDPEGEFGTLREKVDVLIAGPDGDVPVSVDRAQRLAVLIAETGISSVIDMSGLRPQERYRFVQLFLDAFDQLPKKNKKKVPIPRRPRLFVIDEAHLYCPESGKGKAVSAESVVVLMSQGRKRGHGTILITQRLSKIRKDASNECGTFLIGRTAPSDLASAQDALGISKKERDELRNLPAGTFWAAGSGVGTVRKCEVRRSQTSHPAPGEFETRQAPPARRAIKKLLKEFQALGDPDPKPEADATSPKVSRPRTVDPAELRRVAQIEQENVRLRQRVGTLEEQMALRDHNDQAVTAEVHASLKRLGLPALPAGKAAPVVSVTSPPAKHKAKANAKAKGGGRPLPETDLPFSWGSAPGKLLSVALQYYPEPLAHRRLAALAGVPGRKSTFRNALTKLRAANLAVEANGQFSVSVETFARYSPDVPALPSGAELIAGWRNKLGGSPLAIFDALVVMGGKGSRGQVCEFADVDPSVSTARNAYTKLRNLGLLESNTGHELVLAPHVIHALES